MADEKLHPEVEALIPNAALRFRECLNGTGLAQLRDSFREVALLAASKAREEELERNTDACAALANDCASPSWNDAIGECISAIRRGKHG